MWAVVFILVAGVGLGGWQMGYRAGAVAQKSNLLAPGISDVRSISGAVEKVGESSITVKLMSQPGSLSLSTRVVNVDKDTVIERMVPKDQETYQKEQATFMEKMKNQKPGEVLKEPLTPPMPFSREVIKISDIKVGENVNVLAKDNIANKKEFLATSISIMQAPTLPPPGVITPPVTGSASVPPPAAVKTPGN